MNEEQMQTVDVLPAQETGKKKIRKLPRLKKRGKVLLALALAVVLAGSWLLRGSGGGVAAAAAFQTVQAERRDLVVAVSGTATLEPADSYNVTTLISGAIESAPFEEGDLVTQDTLLYTMDSSDARNNVERANISVQQAQLNYDQAREAQHPTATLTGTINEVLVHDGETVSAGTPLATIVASTELSVDFLFPYASPSDFYIGQSATIFINGMAGTVQGSVTAVSNATSITSNSKESVSVRVKLANPGVVSASSTCSAVIGSYTSYGNATITMAGSATVYAAGSGTVSGFSKLAGSTVTKGERLCTIDSESIRDAIENAQLNLRSAQLSAGTTADNLDDYSIHSPISGTIIEKNFKAGDKVDGVSSGTLAVIYDLSRLKMKMNVNELDIGKVRPGQPVEITANALPGQTFTGVVERVSVNGTTTSGFTTYPVTISLEDYGDLKPGMNVSATIQCETVKDAITVPVAAVERGNVVQVPGPGALAEDGVTLADPSLVERRPVVLGSNDNDYIQITSGLEEGETVLLFQQAGAEMGG